MNVHVHYSDALLHIKLAKGVDFFPWGAERSTTKSNDITSSHYFLQTIIAPIHIKTDLPIFSAI